MVVNSTTVAYTPFLPKMEFSSAFHVPKPLNRMGSLNNVQDIITSIATASSLLLFQANLPPTFLVEALNMAIQLLNILPSTAIANDIPYTRLYGKDPNYTLVFRNYGLQLFSLSLTTDLVAYSEADWAGCPTTLLDRLQVQHQRTKHIEIYIHFVRDLVAAGQVRVLHVPSPVTFAEISLLKVFLQRCLRSFRISQSVRVLFPLQQWVEYVTWKKKKQEEEESTFTQAQYHTEKLCIDGRKFRRCVIVGRDKSHMKTRYNLTPFAISLKEITSGLREKLPRSTTLGKW
ncbi:ribonuclease H-like domain-containing protein [Tanacetum coccineum]|uniref:Ribonuclease H-like domain-containing protein n=1 Tax=Tanacetum coccineum TaxID=301880 RepID=A0ABQ4YWA5_9ASTR